MTNRYFRAAALAGWLSLMAGAAFAGGPSLSGQWRSEDTAGGATKGTMMLLADGTARLQPDGFDALEGHWKAEGPFLNITVPNQGSVYISYTLSKDGKTLKVQYEDGRRQTFSKKTDTVKK